MSQKKYTVRRGGRVRVELPAEEQQGAAPGQVRQPGALFPGVQDEELYAFRKGITFYDLGTRKNEDGSYSHVSFEGFTTSGNPYPELLERYHAALLAGDFTKGSTCLKLPQTSEHLWLDAIFRKLGDGPDAGEKKLEIIGNKDSRFYVEDIPLIFPAEPTPANVTEGRWRSAALRFSEKGEWSFEVETAWHYNPFRTDGHGYKVTETAAPAEVDEAPAVEIKVRSGELMRVYLTPRCNWFGEELGGGDELVNMSRLLPVVPGFEAYQVQPFTQIEADLFQSKARAHATPELWALISSYYAGIYPGWLPSVSLIDSDASANNLAITGSPVLAAVIVQRGKTLYVWQTSTTPVTGWKESRVYNPDTES